MLYIHGKINRVIIEGVYVVTDISFGISRLVEL